MEQKSKTGTGAALSPLNKILDDYKRALTLGIITVFAFFHFAACLAIVTFPFLAFFALGYYLYAA